MRPVARDGGWPFAGGEMAQRVREHDWAATPLGAIGQWPASLRTTVQNLLVHPFATIVLWGPQLVQIYNDAYRELMGVKHPAGLGQPTRECWPEVWHINAPIYERVWNGQSLAFEDALFPIERAGSPESAWFTLSYSPVFDEAGTVAGMLLTVVETTRRLQAEAAARASEERLRLALTVGELASWDWDLRTGRVVWSCEHTRMGSREAGEVEPGNESWIARVHPDDRAGTEAALAHAREHHTAYDHEFRSLQHDGSVRWLSAQGRFFHDEHGTAHRMIGVMRDVTEQRNARELLQQRVTERTQALRQLLQHLETVQDEERRRIARELHDGLGQYLSSVALSISGLKSMAAEASMRQGLERLHELMQRLDQELDRMVFILRPTALEDCGLGEGLSAYVHTWSELTGVAVDLELQGLDEVRLPAQLETAAFRVVQESLTNVAKHAQASQVSVTLARRRRQLVGSIEDDGTGFDATDAATPMAGRSHWGLLGIQERIQALGGSMTIESQPGAGTMVLWRVPLTSPFKPTQAATGWGEGPASTQEEQPCSDSGLGPAAIPSLEHTLPGRLAAAEEAVRARDDFLAIAGHELRTPMNALSLQLQAVERMLAQGNGTRAVEELRRARRILQRFVQRATMLLDVSRLNTDRIELEIGAVDVQALVAQVLDAYAEEAASRGARLHHGVEPGLVAQWDGHGMEQVLGNLVTNAIKYGAGTPVEVAAARDGTDRIRLSVADGGPGIDAVHQARVFEKFERVVGVPGTASGFGVGLWLVGRVVQAHGGTIDIDVGPQGGTTFRVTLPVVATSTSPLPGTAP